MTVLLFIIGAVWLAWAWGMSSAKEPFLLKLAEPLVVALLWVYALIMDASEWCRRWRL